MIATHHKVGTILCVRVFSEVAARFGWSFRSLYAHLDRIPPEADIVVAAHGLIDQGAFERSYRGVHLIRHPRDVIESGWRYHRRTSEAWATHPDVSPSPPLDYPKIPHARAAGRHLRQ